MAQFIFARQVYTEGKVLTNKIIHTDNGKIETIEDGSAETADVSVDCLAPGFFDIHINGGSKYNFSKDPAELTLKDLDESCRATGTAFTLPTIISAPVETIFAGVAAVKKYRHNNRGCGVVGMHLEGPFLNPVKRGAHPENFLRHPSDELIDRIIDEGKDVITMITIAPELFSDAQIERLIGSGIIVSAGHSNATYEQANHAFAKGIGLVTHLYNAMSAFQHRAPGLIGAALENENVHTPVIVDGDHCHFAAARLAHLTKKEKFFLISDALFVGGKVTSFQWQEYDALLVDGKYINSEGNLTGAVISLADAVKNMVMRLGVPLAEVIDMVTLRPARALRLDDKLGKIAKGFPARFTVFDEALTRFEVI